MKSFFLTTFILMGSFLIAQNVVLIQESFDDGKYPKGWTVDRGTNWGSNAGNHAGGIKPELVFAYLLQEGFSTPLTGRAHVSLPFVACKNLEKLICTLKYSLVASAQKTNKSFGLMARTSTEGEWKDLWLVSNSPAMEEGKVISIDIGDAYKDMDSVQFALFVESPVADPIQFLFCFDDVFLGNVTATSAKVELSPSPWFGEEKSKAIEGTFINKGTTATAFVASYSVDGGEVKNTRFTQNVKTSQSYAFTCRPELETKEGSQIVKVWISSINGAAVELVSESDTAIKEIYIGRPTYSLRPLFEEFTSASCSFCAPANKNIVDPLAKNEGERFSLIKYQVNIPGKDIYTTVEGEERSFYYKIQGAPSMFANGKEISLSNSSGMLNALQNLEKEKAFFEIKIDSFSVAENGMGHVQYTINSNVNANGLVAHTVLVEKETFKNKGNNGETSFYNVLMKMLPDQEGSKLVLSAENPSTLTFTHDMSKTHTEEFSDLRLIVFIQNPLSGEVFQAAEKDIKTDSLVRIETINAAKLYIYPNPASYALHFQLDQNSQVEIYDLLGRSVLKQSMHAGSHTLDVANMKNGSYVIRVQNTEGVKQSKLVIQH